MAGKDTDPKIATENRAFVSYARVDIEFVRAICGLFDKQGIGVWVDWEDIPPSAEWMAEIRAGIEAADAFAFVMSPRSLASQVCLEELNHAIAVGKRLIPVVLEEASPDQVPEDLQKLNWIFARTPDELPDAVEQILTTLTTDLDKLRRHARILVRAREWIAGSRDNSFLLRDVELREAEDWLARIDEQGPMPVALHTDYILASQQAEREEAARWKQLYEASLTRQLAAQSQLLVDQRGTALPLAALLAVEAAKRAPSLETDQALRKALALMPIRYRGIDERPYPICCYATEGDHVAVIANDYIEIRSIEQDERIKTLEPEGAINARRIQLTPNGRHLAALIDGCRIRIWHLEEENKIDEIDCDQVKVLAFGISSDATRVAITSEDATSRLYDAGTGAIIATIQHEAPMLELALHPDAQEMALWHQSTAEIWDLTSPTCISRISHMGVGFRMQYSPRGTYLALLQTKTFEINVFHVPTRKLILKENRHVDIAFDPQDHIMALASPEWDLTVFNLPSSQRQYRMQHDDSAWRVVFSPDGTRLASYSKDGTIRIWEIEREGREVARIVLRDQRIRDIRFSADSLRLMLINEDGVDVYDARGFREWRLLDLSNPVLAIDAVPTANRLLLGCRNGTWAFIDFERHDALNVIAYSEGENAFGRQIMDVSLVGEKHLLIKRGASSYALLDITSGDTDPSFAALKADVAAGRFGCNTIGAAVSKEKTIFRWRNGDVVRWSVEHGVDGIAVADGGEKIAGLLAGGQVVLCEKNKLRILYRIEDYNHHHIQMDPAGRYLAFWRADDTLSHISVVEIESQKVLSAWRLPSRIHDLRFDTKGEHVVLAMKDKSVQVWNVIAGSALALFRHESQVSTACFTSNDTMIASGSWDGTVRVWPWKAEWLIKAACGRLDRSLTEAEWTQYLPGEPYRETCEVDRTSR